MSELWNSESDWLKIEFLYNIENYLTFKVTVKSGDFQGAYNFCIYKKEIDRLLIENKNPAIPKEILLQDYDSDSFIRIVMTSNTFVIVTGFIGGSHNTNNLNFEFKADQTIFQKLNDIFRESINLM